MPVIDEPDDQQHRLRDDQAEAPGREQRIQRPLVEAPHDEVFDGHADQSRRHRGKRLGDRKRHAELHQSDRHIGAAHDELAVRHVDDAHHAEHDGKACRRKDQKREDVGELIEDRE